jgi:hypothetical protein
MEMSNLLSEVGGVLVAVPAVDDGEQLPSIDLHGGEDRGHFLRMRELQGVSQGRTGCGLEWLRGGVLEL